MTTVSLESLFREFRRGDGRRRRRGAAGDLPAHVGSRLERACGTEIASIPIHHDEMAARATTAFGRPAFAAAGAVDIHPRAFDPASDAGLALIAHEIAHVLQQAGQEPTHLRARGNGFDDPLEQEADAFAAAVLYGGHM